MLRHNILHCLFWTKALVAMLLGLFCLLWFSWRIYDLHSRAVPAFFDGLQSVDVTAPDCNYDPKSNWARLEPQTEGIQMFGFHLDWSVETPGKIVTKLNGFRPNVFNSFMEFSANKSKPAFEFSLLNWYASEAGRVKAMLEISIMMDPADKLEDFKDDRLTELAKALADCNAAYGVPIFLRYGHEMNGPFSSYGFDPVNYVPNFRRMSTILKQYTNMTAIVWAPNIGKGYPFGTSGGVSLPRPGNPNFDLMDTNKDGIIDENDDPYGPWWPGAEYVDWVGLSLYYYPPDEIQLRNHAVPETYFESYLTGVGYNQGANWEHYYNFYRRFALEQNKPMMLPETGSPYLYNISADGTPGVSASNPGDAAAVQPVDLRLQWFNQIMNPTTLAKYPKLKLMVNFEEEKVMGLPSFFRDWKLTFDPIIATAILKLFKGWSTHMKEGNQFDYHCNGAVVLNGQAGSL
ncbi:glycoside hydrolase [Rhizoclosmatium globosum]|uniref:Glycoside hydrolase n=1 Tax=Rhizoclosmatium globosum TaxID=329046 RepID=A0A1Y2BWC7_9FUNG|nr:glycoside hydrolase [Rhizoclosmatium globosum]|eukprot:ORY39061.1 glycoside hydrolase [Rhizoclosmatium globosum]